MADRRDFLRLAGTAVTVAVLPACGGSKKRAFFGDAERRAAAALADHLLPRDQDPGASDLGVVDYIENLLTAFESDPPAIFASGPYSGRAPFPTQQGTPSTHFPPDEFAVFEPLDRVTEYVWRLKLYGSKGVPGGGPNDAALHRPVIGLRELVPQGLEDALSRAGAPLETLAPAQLEAVWVALDPAFRSRFQQLVYEGAFAPPEYGGNRDLAGWRIAHFDGDSQPLGFSVWSETAQAYRERPDKPMTGPEPLPDPDPIDPQTQALIEEIVAALGGQVFP
jgi:hypothetical protein